MTTEKQLTIPDLLKLPPEIKLSVLAARAGIHPNILHIKIKRWRDGIPDALTEGQSAAITGALRGIVEEIEAAIGLV